MQLQQTLISIFVTGLLLGGLAACQKTDEASGPAESAGRELDQAAATTNEKLERAGEKISAGAIDLTRKAGEKLEQAGEKMQSADKDDK